MIYKIFDTGIIGVCLACTFESIKVARELKKQNHERKQNAGMDAKFVRS